MIRTLLYIFLFYSNFFVFSQEITGKVIEIIDNEEIPVVGANVYWIDNSGGTISNIDGDFKLENSKNNSLFIISNVGYQNDTLEVGNSVSKIILKKDSELDEVSIEYNRKSSSVSLLSSSNVINIS